MHILFLNGPNLNLLGIREPDIYGTQTYADLESYIRSFCADLGVTCDIFQSNYEGALVDRIQAALGTADAIVLNAAAYTHTSVALLDALLAVSLPAVEVHLSDPMEREDFRHVSYCGRACLAAFSGYGFESYRKAAEYLINHAKI